MSISMKVDKIQKVELVLAGYRKGYSAGQISAALSLPLGLVKRIIRQEQARTIAGKPGSLPGRIAGSQRLEMAK